MDYSQQVAAILCDALQINTPLTADSPLLGHLPELDSMAIVSVIEHLESHYGIMFEDDEISADHFETVGTLAELITQKVSNTSTT